MKKNSPWWAVPMVCIVILLSYSKYVLPAAPSSSKLNAPDWHNNDWWRIKVPVMLVTAPMSLERQSITLSDKTFDYFRYTVIGKKPVPFHFEDPTSKPTEQCWVVNVVKENRDPREDVDHYLLYFRVKDKALRGIVIDHKGERSYHTKQYYSISPPFNSNTRPFSDSSLPPIAEWPVFPMKLSESDPISQMEVQHITSQIITMKSMQHQSLQVTFHTGQGAEDTETQTWVEGLPWWLNLNRGAFTKAQLIETNHMKLSN